MRFHSLVLTIAIIFVFAIATGHGEEKKVDIPRLNNIDAFQKDYREAARAIVNAITEKGLKPREYFAEVVRDNDGNLIFVLWHETALNQRGSGIHGDPSGKCREATYDVQSRQVINLHAIR